MVHLLSFVIWAGDISDSNHSNARANIVAVVVALKPGVIITFTASWTENKVPPWGLGWKGNAETSLV